MYVTIETYKTEKGALNLASKMESNGTPCKVVKRGKIWAVVAYRKKR
jgi:hypothetical protein